MLDQVQGSKEWHVQRRLRIGGSEIATIMGISPWNTPYRLWMEKTGLVEPEDISNKPHVVRGVLAEPVAREKYNRLTEKNFTPKVWPVIDGCLGASDDGYNEETNEIIEIKCMGEQAHEDAKAGVIPEYYRMQMTWTMGISGATKCQFVSCRPESDYELVVIEVLADMPSFLRMRIKALDFWEMVKTKTPPPLSDKDVVDFSDNKEFIAYVREYSSFSKTLAELELKVEATRAKLISLAEGYPSVKCGPLKLSRFTRKGSIEYGKIEALKGFDLEPYRKPATVAFKITLGDENAKT